jgi:hypothetical protein
MGIENVYGLPGVRAARTASYRNILRQGEYSFLSTGVVIGGADARDPGNTPVTVLRAGLLMGMNTTTKEWAPSILGVVQSAYTSGGTQITVTAAQAVEIVRRVGSSGTATLRAIGPPTANGTLASTNITYSAVDTTTGIITVTDLGVDKVAGTFITDTDGTENPRSFIPEGRYGYGMKVTDNDGNSLDVPWALVPIGGVIDASQLLDWPSDTSIQKWIKDHMNGTQASGVVGVGSGKFVFDSDYQ